MSIKVAFSGQIDKDTKISFTYPEPYNSDISTPETQWLRGIFDPRSVAREFDAKKIFVFWTNPMGNYYGYIVPNRKDTRNGYLLITIYSGKEIIYDGKALDNAFLQLEKLLILNPVEPSPADIARVVSTLPLSEPVVPLNMNPAGSLGFRAYNTNADLCKALGNCDQANYSSFSKVAFIPTTAVPAAPVPGVTEITQPLQMAYTVASPLPAGVRTDRNRVRLGDTLTIIMQKEGFTSQTIPVNITGVPDDKLRYTLNEIIITPPAMDQASFSRKVRLDVSDEHGNTINGLRVQGGTNQCKMQGKTIQFLNQAPAYDIVLTTTNGKSANVHITPEDLEQGFKKIVIPLGLPKPTSAAPAGPESSNVNTLRYVLFGVVGVIFVYMIYATIAAWSAGVAWPFNSSKKEAKELVDTTANNADQKCIDEATADINEKEDLLYMKANDTWNIAQLKSKKYRQLADYLRSGNISGILSQDWFTATQDKNGYFPQIVDALKTLPGDKQAQAAEKMRAACTGDNVNLSAMYSGLKSLTAQQPTESSYQPAAPAPAVRTQGKIGGRPGASTGNKGEKKGGITGDKKANNNGNQGSMPAQRPSKKDENKGN